MAKFLMGLTIFSTLIVGSCTNGPDYAPGPNAGSEGDGDGDAESDVDRDMDSDDESGCPHECVEDDTTCAFQGGTEHTDLHCPNGAVCCEIEKSLEDTDTGANQDPDTGANQDPECIYECMPSWLCSFRGDEHADMTCQGANVCCEVGGTPPGDDPNNDPNDALKCEYECINSFRCRFQGEEHPEMSCDGNSVCCEIAEKPGDTDNGGQTDTERPDPGETCAYECVRRNRCESRGGQRIPSMQCEGNRECCRF